MIKSRHGDLDEQTLMRYVKFQEKEDLGQAKLALD
jgi:hypothetical protein